MKKILLSSLLLAGFAGVASAQIAVYGLIDASYGKSIADGAANRKADFHSGGDDGSGQGNSTTRVGVKGSTDLGGGIKGNFRFESNGITSDGDVPAPFFKRQAWFGLSGSFGEVRLGRQNSVPFQTMIDYDFNGASNGVSSLGYANVGPWLPGRQSRSLQYILPKMGSVSVQFGFVPEGNSGKKATPSAGVTYADGALSLSAAYQAKEIAGGDNFSSLAGSYDLGAVKLMVAWADGGKTAKGNSFGAVAPVAGFNVGMLYGKNTGTKGSAWEIFVNKEVLKNTTAYFEYGSADAKTGTDGQGFAVGLIYAF